MFNINYIIVINCVHFLLHSQHRSCSFTGSTWFNSHNLNQLVGSHWVTVFYAQSSAEPWWSLKVSMAAASSREPAEAWHVAENHWKHGVSMSKINWWSMNLSKVKIIDLLWSTCMCLKKYFHKLQTICFKIRHRWHLCIHCAGRVIDILMQPARTRDTFKLMDFSTV